MGVVTISALYGAGGPEIAGAVAGHLGLPFHDRAIPVQVADRLGVPVEEAEETDQTVVRGLLGLIAELGHHADPLGGVMPDARHDERAYQQQTERVVEGVAEGVGGVVLGRGAAFVLGDRHDVLNVRLHGPVERRLAAVAARTARPEAEIRHELEANDRTREAYVRHFYGCDPSSPRYYHLMIDGTALPLDSIVHLIVGAAEARGIGTR